MKGPLRNKKILVTYGPTWVSIDDMRVISNRSTGMMGQLLIKELLQAGASVTALQGPVLTTGQVHPRLTVKKFMFFDELRQLLKKELRTDYDAVIHAAAVSDFYPKTRCAKKIASEAPLVLKMEPTKKIINHIKGMAPRSLLIGFKLESSSAERTLKRAAIKLITHSHCDYVIANCVKKGYSGFIFDHHGRRVSSADSRQTISRHLIAILSSHFNALSPKTAEKLS